MPAKNKPNEIYISRIYDAPVKMVWEAWVDPEQVGKWWGPRGFTLTTQHKDVKVGGTWRYVMHGPDGVDYPNLTTFHEVEKYSRLVYDHGASDDRPPLFRVTVDFTEVGKKTKMELTMALATAEAAQETKKFIKKAGGDSTWDRLAEFLAPNDQFVINRSFEASLEKIYSMWTDPGHLAQWCSPKGSSMKFFRADIKTGGSSFYSMKGPGDHTMYGTANYLEIQKPHRIVYVQAFCDENEKITRHPMSATWPEKMLTTITLSEEAPNRTRVTIVWQIHGDSTPVERETFNQAKSGMTQGWGGSFDNLEAYLKKD